MYYTNLPVFKIAYDMNVNLFKVTKKFDREYKYTLGEKLKELSLEIIINIFKANKNPITKFSYIDATRECTEQLKILLRIARDIRILSIKQFANFQTYLEPLSKQLVSWQRYESKQERKGRRDYS
jgi:virulence-associated protein VapD